MIIFRLITRMGSNHFESDFPRRKHAELYYPCTFARSVGIFGMLSDEGIYVKTIRQSGFSLVRRKKTKPETGQNPFNMMPQRLEYQQNFSSQHFIFLMSVLQARLTSTLWSRSNLTTMKLSVYVVLPFPRREGCDVYLRSHDPPRWPL